MTVDYETIAVHTVGTTTRVQLNRPGSKNAINDRMIDECRDVLARQHDCTVLVVQGSSEFFCTGADFDNLSIDGDENSAMERAERLYDLFLELATGPYVSVAHVQGAVNGGGMGLVAACDVVISSSTARFGLSELLFGLYPACVLPFLIRRCGRRVANYLALTTAQYSAADAMRLGVVDVEGPDSGVLLSRHLARLEKLPRSGICRYKRYLGQLDGDVLTAARPLAAAGNAEVFTDRSNLALIKRFVDSGVMPWE